MGECPYEGCDGDLWVTFDEENLALPQFYKHECEKCKKLIWTYLSRVEPQSYTEEAFNEKFVINEETKSIKER